MCMKIFKPGNKNNNYKSGPQWCSEKNKLRVFRNKVITKVLQFRKTEKLLVVTSRQVTTKNYVLQVKHNSLRQ